MGELSRRPAGRSKKALVATLGILSIAAAVSTAAPVAASTGITVMVGYADSFRANPTNFPTPWAGSPNTIFHGCPARSACTFDAGAVEILNNTGGTVHVTSVAVHVGSCTFTGWAGAVLPNGSGLIVTQTAPVPTETCDGPAQLDSSDIGILPHCVPDGIVPVVDVTIDGTTTSYVDTGQVLNTEGIDYAECVGNESIQWTKIGSPPCRGSVLTLAPPSQTHGVGTTATVIGTFANGCAQPLQNVSVQFAIIGGPNNGRTGSGTTGPNGQATFSYSSAVTGTDTLRAAVTNVIGTLTSNTVTVTWLAYAPGGGAFVISDIKNVQGGSVYWWGAQWWKKDPLTTGLAPAAFKGYEKSNLAPSCGQTWTTRPGNSPPPPRTVPVNANMLVIVSSHITKKGPVITGDIVHIVLVHTNPGYAPNPGHPGTGTIVSTIC